MTTDLDRLYPDNASDSSRPANEANPLNPPDSPKSSSSSKKKKPKKKLWIRIILKTLRWLLVPTLCLIALFIGLVIGYVRIGGQPYSDIFDPATWKHLYELVYSNT
jgi:lipopolysaccharide export LptBFGC system permease protein LptF